jgi:hypothetical protein
MSATRNKTLDLEDGGSVALPFHALAVRETPGLVLVLLDPDDYLNDESYRSTHKSGDPSLKNLMAFDRRGGQVWVAEMPEATDYYYSIEHGLPIRALSYSGYRCLIDENTGRIIERELLK